MNPFLKKNERIYREKPMANLAILSLDNQDIQTDARVQRQVHYLSRHHEIHLITYGSSKLLDLPSASMKVVGSLNDAATKRRFNTLFWLSLGKLLPDFAYRKWYWGRPGHRAAFEALIDRHPDLVIANDWWSLPVAAEACKQTGARLILDLHEYAPGEFEHQTWWRVLYKPVVNFFLNCYLKDVDASVTVNPVIADRYNIEFGLKPVVVMNIPRTTGRNAPQPTDADHIELIHHGAAMRDRKIELMIDVIALTDSRYHLNFMLVGNPAYVNELKQYSERKAPGRVSFLEPVSPDKVVETNTKFDVGIYLTPAAIFQLLAMLPNKFFDYLAASLAVCFGPYLVMKALIEQYQCGLVCDSFDPQEMADRLSRLSAEEIDRMKQNSYWAGEKLNSEIEMDKLVQLVNETLA
jgi:glycosyltransferase involved in cell wall biosynthesis